MPTAVLQSHTPQALRGWIGDCCASVRDWAEGQGWDYRWRGDDLFTLLPPDLAPALRRQPVVAADLARLYWLAQVLEEGYQRVIWCDADVLVFRPFSPPAADHGFGREVWVQAQRGRLRSYRKIHNAWLMFNAGSAVLPFYLDRAEALLRRAALPVVPQLVGPKLLTALHNLVGFEVEERAGMLSPLALRDLLAGGGEALRRTVAGHAGPLCALNLCASYEGRAEGALRLGAGDYREALRRLRSDPAALDGLCA